jgi:arylsulfatase A
MTLHRALQVLLFSLGSITLSAASPNVILIMADDFGYECVTANGGTSYQTPHLDRLAEGGARFTQCHSQPLCTPTRVQLMTGYFNVRNYSRFGVLPRTETTFGHLFQKAGYATAICGKWQLGSEPDAPQHFGFQEAYLWQHTRRPPRYANPGVEHNAAELDFNMGEYGPTLINDFALDFITRHKDQPFFLYYPMILTHDPFQPAPDSPHYDPTAMGENVNKSPDHFASMTAYMDKMIGRIDSKLAELGIRDNTLLLFLGDNGTHRTIFSEFEGRPYQGGKGSTNQRGTRVPLIVSWPGKIQTPTVCDDLISAADFLPTICQAAGIDSPEDTDGISFLDQILSQPATPREWLYIWYSPRQKADFTVKAYAFNHHLKLYQDGTVYDLRTDPFEDQALTKDQLQDPQDQSQIRTLQHVLDHYNATRPEELDSATKTYFENLPPAEAKQPKGKGKGQGKGKSTPRP